jgi:hypothetical protein
VVLRLPPTWSRAYVASGSILYRLDLVPVLAGSLDHPLPISQVKRPPCVPQGQPEKANSSRWAMWLPRGHGRQDCESSSKNPMRCEPLRGLLLFGPALLQCRPACFSQGDSLGSTLNNKTFSIPPASDRNPANCICPPSPAALPLPPCLVPATWIPRRSGCDRPYATPRRRKTSRQCPPPHPQHPPPPPPLPLCHCAPACGVRWLAGGAAGGEW